MYRQMGEVGLFEGRRVQLIDGVVVDMGAMGTPHAEAIRVLTRVFVTLAGSEVDVMVQLPIAASEVSEPEPDFSFVPRLQAPAEDHPATALLAIEVADSSLKFDLGRKARLYAETGVPEYWVIDLKARSTVVHLTPRRGRYASVKKVPWTSPLTSTSLPSITVRFAELLKR